MPPPLATHAPARRARPRAPTAARAHCGCPCRACPPATAARAQAALRKVVQGVGGLEHADFRAFRSERKECEARGFVDGDLVEAFLDLSPQDASKVGGRRWGCVWRQRVEDGGGCALATPLRLPAALPPHCLLLVRRAPCSTACPCPMHPPPVCAPPLTLLPQVVGFMGPGFSVEEVTRRVEELARLH